MRRSHLGVSVLDEGIHHDHYQDGDGDPEVPDDSTQLWADEATSCVHILRPTRFPSHPTSTRDYA